MYKEQRLSEKRQQGGYGEGKLRLEMRRGRKRGGLARMGQREAGEKVNVVYTVGGKMREEKTGGSPTRGCLEEKGTSAEGGTFVFLDPSSCPALPQRSQVPASTSTDWSTVTVHHVGGAGGRQGLSYTFQDQVEFSERHGLTQRQMQ